MTTLTLMTLGERPITSLIKGYNPLNDVYDGEPQAYHLPEPPPEPTLIARYQGHCATCDGSIHPGELILSDPWRHATCPEADATVGVRDTIIPNAPARTHTRASLWPKPSSVRRALYDAVAAGGHYSAAAKAVAAYDDERAKRSQLRMDL